MCFGYPLIDRLPQPFDQAEKSSEVLSCHWQAVSRANDGEGDRRNGKSESRAASHSWERMKEISDAGYLFATCQTGWQLTLILSSRFVHFHFVDTSPDLKLERI